jgi:hypothetical protein
MNNFDYGNPLATLDLNKFNSIINSSFTTQYPLTAPFASFVKKGCQLAHARKQNKLLAQARADIEKEYPEVFHAQLQLREGDGLSGDFQWLRLGEILSLVNHFEPKNVVEFGGGGSSIAFANALATTAKFISYDASEYWQKKMLNSSKDSNKIDARVAEVRIEEMDGEGVSYFDIDHSLPCDFVYVDGPHAHESSLSPDDSRRELFATMKILDPTKHIPNVDVELMWKEGIYPKVVMIDGRRATVRRLWQKLPDGYSVYLKSSYLLSTNMRLMPDYRYHTIFVRDLLS